MTTTTNLGITEVAAAQNQKEVTINDGLDALDQAGNSRLAISFTANARTLSGAEYTRAVCFYCGVLTGSGTLTVPLTKRLFVVDNTFNNSPAHDLVVGGATGGTSTVTGGAMALLYCDGTDVKPFSAVSSGAVSSFNTRTGAVVLTAADFAALDLSGLPTSDPGSGKAWLNGGVLQVGA